MPQDSSFFFEKSTPSVSSVFSSFPQRKSPVTLLRNLAISFPNFSPPYVIWFAFVPGMVLFFLRKSKEDYIKCCKVIYGGMSICLLIYYLFPNGLSLRQPLEDKNICCMIVNQLRSADTPANVCPSIHVSSTIGILFVLFHSEKLKNYRKLKATMLVLGTFICISTVVI